MESTGAQNPRFTFALADVFFLTGIFAVVAFAASNIGPTSVIFWVALVILSALSALAIASLASGKSTRVIWIMSFAFFLPALCLMWISIPLLLSSVLHAVLAIACSFGEFNRRFITRSSLLITAASLLVWSIITPPLLTNLYALRKQYPIESVAERLEYESQPERSPSAEDKPSLTIDLKPAAKRRLEDNDLFYSSIFQDMSWNSRVRLLQRTHSESLEQFLRSNGFGVGRMAPLIPSNHRIEVPSLRSIAFEENLDAQSAPQRDVWSQSHVFGTPTGEVESLDQFHQRSLFDFLNPEGFGWIAKPKNSAGFIPHAFHGIQTITALDEQKWQLRSLQLISLDRFDLPRAYVLDYLPRMDHLNSDDVQTRTLTTFENDSLPKLETDEDIVFLAGHDSIEMLGSIRAQQKCLDCHSVRRGQLLGAFSYRFSPINEPAMSETDDSEMPK